MKRAVVGTALLCALWCLPASAQVDEARAAAERLEVGQLVRLTAPGLWLEDVALQTVGPDSLHLADQGAVVAVGYDELESLSFQVGHTRTGALIGGGSGLLVGSLFGAMISAFGCPNPSSCTTSERSGAAWGAGVGLLAGAIAGAWIGSASKSWQPIFP